MLPPPQRITKEEAAKRQLSEAIRLFFERRDPVAVHTLTCAALQVLADLGRNKGADSFLKGAALVREEKKKEWFSLMSRAQNFFKHADKDPEDTLEFHPAATPFFIHDAVMLEKKVTGASSPACLAFNAWFCLSYPDLMLDGPEKQSYLNLLNGGADPRDFPQFLKLIDVIADQLA